MSRFRTRKRIAAAAALTVALVTGVSLMLTAQAAPNAKSAATPRAAHSQQQSPDSGPAVHHDVSPTLRAMAAASGPAHGPRVAPDINTPIPHPPAANAARSGRPHRAPHPGCPPRTTSTASAPRPATR